jgi:HSP20 family protein
MSTLNKITNTVRESLDVLAEGWQDLWHKARHAITHFTPASDDGNTGGNRWGLLSAELLEGSDEITVSIEAPGLEKQDFEIFVDSQMLVIKGTKQSSRERSEGHYHITERAYGRFERLVPLPCEVDEGKTRATYKGGVLTIMLPKSKEAQPRIISIS